MDPAFIAAGAIAATAVTDVFDEAPSVGILLMLPTISCRRRRLASHELGVANYICAVFLTGRKRFPAEST